MTWPRPSFLELIQQFPEPLFIRMLEVGCDGGRCDARLDRDQVRSMPTSETRADASMTMPLSRTRSSTSISISDARKMPRVFRHLVRNNYKRVDRNMWLRICRNYARGAHFQQYNQLVRAPKARLRQNTKWRRSRWPRPMFLPASPFRMVLPPPLVLRRGRNSAQQQTSFASCVPAPVLSSKPYPTSLPAPPPLPPPGL